jgi:preprotein translocase subunit SecD
VAAPSGQLKPGRYFAVIAGIIIVLYAIVFAAGNHKPQPKLGLDLQGGTSMTLSAKTLDGKAPDNEKLDVARGIIAQRVDSTGVSEAEVTVQGNENVVVNVAGSTDPNQLRQLVAPAFLDFRAVLGSTQDNPNPTGTPSPSASPSGSPSGSPSAQPSASPSTSAPASPSPSGSAAAAPAPSASASAPEVPSNGAGIADLNAVKKKVGTAAYDAADGITDPTNIDAATLAKLAPFAKLTPAEVAALPAKIQFSVPQITCATLNNRIPQTLTNDAALKQQVVACGGAGSGAESTKLLLDMAKVQGKDVSSASSGYDLQQGGNYVSLSFHSTGQKAWTQLTQDAINKQQQDGQPHQVAIVLDNEVLTAPNINEVIPGSAIINGGNITAASAKTLATQLKFGSLPLSFQILSVENVSPTLGLAQMKAGLLAGAIGLILVVLYCLLYYRALGLIVIASLVVSAAIVFASLVLLGRSINFTLSLAGIAGFIVAIGITADSFVVFFERLKDEVKEGRSVRSSVPRAWARARRTILSADAVSILAAIVLYALASGQVAGFAFTLGLSTIIDLLVVFLFTHPLVAVLSGSRTFTSPKFSGLVGVRETVDTDANAGRLGAMRTKES